MKTVQELLEPRYKVIGDYPNSPFEVGKILELRKQNDALPFAYVWWEDRGQRHTLYESEINGYPHLFKKLEWWEERKPEDMPEYVRFTLSPDNEVWEAKDWKVTKVFGMEFWNESGGRKFRNICSECCVVPATLSEYTTYISQTKP